MKILHVINDLSYGGAQSLLSDFLCVQKQEGEDVAVLCLVESSSGFVDKLKNARIPVYTISTGSVYNPLLIVKVAKFFRDFDIVHSHLFPANYWVGFAKIISFSKTPLITTEHSTHNRRRNHWILKNVDKFVYKYLYNITVCCSDKAFETFIAAYPKVCSLSIPNGINIARFKNALALSKETMIGINGGFIITMVARFQYPKRQDLLIKVLNNLPLDVHLVLVGGDGTQGRLEQCKRIMHELGLSDRIHFLGLRNDVASILKTSDINILASEYEGLSLSSVEGMAVGKPFLASNVNGLKEVVDGAGLLFDNNNPDELTHLILKIYNDSNYAATIANKCSDRANQYDINGMANTYKNLYESLIALKK